MDAAVNTGRRWAVCHGHSAAVGDWLLLLHAEPHMYGVGMRVMFKKYGEHVIKYIC
jgi:hypothetical protein